MPLTTVHTVADLRATVADWRAQGLRVALVPTMGALHDGHISLTRLAREHADRVIVSIFVNPTQFGPNEDFGAYPRTLPDDQKLLDAAGVELCFAPSVEEMYPDGFATKVSVDGAMTNVLCGAARPGHFDGVAQIVTKLLLQALPDCAIFGQKDYQQLMVIRRFSADLNIPVDIIGAKILREEDGLAMSSRNRYLSPQERETAPVLNRVLADITARAAKGAELGPLLAKGREDILAAGFNPIDYLEVRDAQTLELVSQTVTRPARIFVAARLGKARLIDNHAIDPVSPAV
ncbi:MULTISPECIES: pantoate--beta-alanine ligase [Thalassospira]|jgi:pantoate--beta-alanine ligase|uniref:Pantothenate synthetase n=1 Tax=Thalassospira povalilytica TaxID=732237 RepID=A0ABX4R7B8_9PROT|nr:MULTISPECIES: pantoate--beta-alanine ligase [Thalassospira]MEE3045854.1 pantoate--beta-alanine ligase [Pseudomonadota bacterium]KZB59061.1 pantoate--beta-alanine ligase [Thalassospira sp. MCCC 1A02491]MBO6771432.1 pantoate--beta-alanine ligase [Thalassospira sp.]PKR49361.1 pantoate--beta-alanine ligase [Thalassospira povalilytica]URK16149.1 pantoate--beta-alanine ligase [Thalassospira sp. GO-4]